ncbi:MAG: transposase [Alphaproteobacteria bacterium]
MPGPCCSAMLIRRRWPDVTVSLRADSGFAHDGLMSRSEVHGVDYVFGLARNSRLIAAIAPELARAEATGTGAAVGPSDGLERVAAAR